MAETSDQGRDPRCICGETTVDEWCPVCVPDRKPVTPDQQVWWAEFGRHYVSPGIKAETLYQAIKARLARELQRAETADELRQCYTRTGLEAFIAKHFPDSQLTPKPPRPQFPRGYLTYCWRERCHKRYDVALEKCPACGAWNRNVDDDAAMEQERADRSRPQQVETAPPTCTCSPGTFEKYGEYAGHTLGSATMPAPSPDCPVHGGARLLMHNK